MSPSVNNDDLVALDKAFLMACAELGLGANSKDSERLVRLSQIVISIANGGERHPTVIAQRAVWLMKANEVAL